MSVQIYGGKLFDLLNGRQRLTILEDGKKRVCIVGLREYLVDGVDVLKQLIEHSNAARSTGSTGANADSSRSHSIMQVGRAGMDCRLESSISGELPVRLQKLMGQPQSHHAGGAHCRRSSMIRTA